MSCRWGDGFLGYSGIRGLERSVHGGESGGRVGDAHFPHHISCWRISSELGPSGPQTGGADLSPTADVVRPVLDALSPVDRPLQAAWTERAKGGRRIRTSLKIGITGTKSTPHV